MTVRVSVLMTIYNAGPFLGPAVDGLLAQTFRDFEVVAVENGSTDGSKDVLRQYAASNPRVKLIDLPQNVGRTRALNIALNAAQGEYIAVLDADDLTVPDRFERQVHLLDRDPSVVLVAGGMRFIYEKGAVISTFQPPTAFRDIYDMLAYSNPIAHSACMYRRREALHVGGYPTRFTFAQDFGLILSLVRRGKIAMLPELIVDTREHEGRMTRASQIAFNRLYEELELFGVASSLPGLSKHARRRGRAARASLHLRLAKLWLENHSIGRASMHIVRCIVLAPVYCLKTVLGLRQRIGAV